MKLMKTIALSYVVMMLFGAAAALGSQHGEMRAVAQSYDFFCQYHSQPYQYSEDPIFLNVTWGSDSFNECPETFVIPYRLEGEQGEECTYAAKGNQYDLEHTATFNLRQNYPECPPSLLIYYQSADNLRIMSTPQTWAMIEGGETKTYDVERGGIPVESLMFTIREGVTLDEPSIFVSALDVRPVGVAPVGEGIETYKFISIEVENLRDLDVVDATITYSVPEPWLETNNIERAELYRYAPDGWRRIASREAGPAGDRIVYRAVTTGFSLFAIAGEPAEAAEPPAPTQPTQPPAGGDGAGNGPQPPPGGDGTGDAPDDEDAGTAALYWVIGIIAVIVIVVLIGIALSQPRR